MVVETRYAAGSGVLIGAGRLWLLVTDPGDEAVVAELWTAVTGPADDRGGPTVADRVLAIVDRAFPAPPDLALVDLSSPAGSSVSRGTGRVHVEGSTRVLTLDAAGAVTDEVPLRHLVGGVVAADRAEVRPLAAGVAARPVAPSPAASSHAASSPAAGAGLIDGIPAAILDARGPEGAPPPRPRRVPRPEPIPAAAEPVGDTGALPHTAEPDPLARERIEEGGHTTIRPPVPADPAPPDPGPPGAALPAQPADDHDGSTVHRPAGHLQHSTRDTVLAVSCPAGHLGPATSPTCRVCHLPIAPQEPRRVDRPTLGGLRLPTGEVVPLDRGVVLGRKPAPVQGSHDWPHLVHLPSGHSFVSRMHLQVELDGWHVAARDLGSRGGTLLKVPGREPEWLRSGEAYVLEPGHVLDLAEVYEVRFEVGAVAGR